MRLKAAATVIAFIGALGLLAAPAGAAPKKKVRVVYRHDSTVYVSRDENGRKRTRIIIQKRSYLDPGTETFPGERGDHDYAQLPGQRATSILDNTAGGANQTALPGPFTLPFKNNPWLQY
ncbi:MAG TPA: hypothetical protein VGV41_15335 [Pseudolabrys sp.]|jgi:hypothetical protein|uniref:hypothetical protein n=1 Tax=Pseudolabrys sp. TaxID=1960880 RepID=UPI002DDD56DD|nr:hypothetical protein [Pseudolabrys sp.]HEV2630006.1 hypothetical protein [Pseudolabrys sp.]